MQLRVVPVCDGFSFQLRADFDISKEKLKGITDHMLSEMDAGLASAGTSSLLMIPTHLTTVPTGQETGSYLALDLGGTNFRVLKVGFACSDSLPGCSLKLRANRPASSR